ncbi:MAG: folate family ECF transporter S component [Lachnospiraceae bacterium]|nr:folate family ECF transporter S component [Lachnospiraceae bacterium]
MIVYLGLLTALEIVLSRFLSINAWNTKIGFSFIPIVAAAILFGPLPAAIVGALGDFLGALIFPIGPYFPGFTATAFICGIVRGLFLRKKHSFGKTVLLSAVSAAICQLILGLFLNTLWIGILYGTEYAPLLITRITQCVLLFVVETAVAVGLSYPLRRLKEAFIINK